MSALDVNLSKWYQDNYAASNYLSEPKRVQSKDNWTQANMSDATNMANLALAKWQYQANLEQWQRENEYNSPAAQMQRYQDAGLNPNLIYGQQNLSAGSPQASVPQLQSGKLVNTRAQRAMAKLNVISGAAQQIMSMLEGYQTLQQKSAQTDMIKANTRLIWENAENASRRGTILDYQGRQAMADTFMKQFNWKHQSERYSLETAKTRQAINNMRKQGLLMGEQLSLYGDGLTPSSSMLQHTFHDLFNGDQSFGWSFLGNVFIGILDYIGKIFK